MQFDFDEFEDLLLESSEAKKPEPQIFGVSDFLEISNQVFENNFSGVMIEGEVSSFKINQNKFVFFDLKEGDSTINCFMTIWQLNFPISDGMKILVQAQPKITKWGKFSLTVQKIIPKGEGSIKKSFDELKKKLKKEGIFSDEHKKIVPKNPQNIAVISSVQAAGYADFVKILDERWGGLNVRVAHTQVQGMVAAEQIIRAIDFLNNLTEKTEVIAIIRGGGSADDLAVFNDENLVRAIFASKIPIITGIGHETDEVLADLVADLVASTPSNVAQILTPDKNSEINFIHSKINLAKRIICEKLSSEINENSNKIFNLQKDLLEKIENSQTEIASKIRIVKNLDPNKILAQGYAILRGEVIAGGEIQIEKSDKIITAEVKNVQSK